MRSRNVVRAAARPRNVVRAAARRWFCAVSGAGLLSLSGCMVGPDYHRPPATVPAAFKELPGWKFATPSDAAPKGPWWIVYHDPVLDHLEVQVAVNNQTVREAEAAYRQAQALVQEARANLYPTLGVSAGVTRASGGGGGSRVSTLASSTTLGGVGAAGTVTGTGVSTGAVANGVTAATPGVVFGGSSTYTDYSLEGSANWDLDVWGRIRRQIESQVAAAQVSAADLANAQLSEQAALATDYFELRASDALQQLLDQTVVNYQKSLLITENQYNAGVAAQSDVITARTQLEGAQASAVNVGVARAQYEHAIAVLTGVPPAVLTLLPGPLAGDVPYIPAVLPAVLLERRPDIAAAERQMEEENALVGAAVAAYYPDISLSASYGYSGDPLRSLISAVNRIWSLGAGASETLFEGGARTAAVAAARAAYDASVATYRQTVLTALQQVEDQLAALRILTQQGAIETAAVRDAARATEIALNEYRAGTQVYTTVVTAQNTELADQETALSVEESRLTSSVALIEALGGGWKSADLPSKDSLQRGSPLLPDF